MGRRPLLIALVASLALNVFLVGGLAGAGLTGWRLHAFEAAARPKGGMAAVGAALPPPERRAWRQALRAQNQTSGPKLRQARMARRAAWLTFASDPLDARGVLSQLQQARDLEMRGRSEIDQAVVNFAVGLPPADRAKLGEELSQAQSPPPGRPASGRYAVGPDQAQPGLPNR